MNIDDQIEAAMRHAADNAARAEANPEAAVFGTFTGRCKSGAVTVQVDALGRLEHLEIAEGNAREGDERALPAAILEANADARRALEDAARESLEGYQPPSAEQSPSYHEDEGEPTTWRV